MGDHAPTAWFHEHRPLSLPSFPPSVAAGQTHISHPAVPPPPPPLGQRGPGSGLRALGARAHLILAVASLPGLYGIVRGITLWPDLPTVPRSRAWIGWTRAGLTQAELAR